MRDNVAVHSHPIADSVNQLSVASIVRLVNDVVKLPVGDFLKVCRHLYFSVALFFVIRDGENQTIISTWMFTTIGGKHRETKATTRLSTDASFS